MSRKIVIGRYLVPLNTAKGCLNCHGTPVGEKDVAGFAKEVTRKGAEGRDQCHDAGQVGAGY